MLTIDRKENAVVRPLIEEGRQELFLSLLEEKFGPVPAWATDQVHRASAEQLERWARRILRSASLEETLDADVIAQK